MAGCKPETGADATASSDTVLTVATTTVESEQVSRLVSATGTIMPWQELTVGAEAAGLAVTEVRVKENDAVRGGDVLVRLDDRSLRAQVAQQQAAVTEAQANLRSAKQEATRGDVLAAQKAMSQELAETRRTAILTSQAKLDQATAALEQLQAQLDQTVIRAPAAGIVSAEPVRLGTVTQTGTELARIIREGRLEAQVKVPEHELGQIKAGQNVTVSLSDGGTVAGRVRDVAAKLDATTRLGVAYVSLPSNAAIRAGMFATAAIEVERTAALMVAEGALVWPDGKPSVFVVGADGRASLRTVTVAERSGSGVVVDDGVAEGERVVTEGAGFLHDGDRVAIRPALAAADTPTAKTASGRLMETLR